MVAKQRTISFRKNSRCDSVHSSLIIILFSLLSGKKLHLMGLQIDAFKIYFKINNVIIGNHR